MRGIPFRKLFTKRKKKDDRRGRHTKFERIKRNKEAYESITLPICRNCTSYLDAMYKTEEGDAIVCTACGVVDNNTCFDLESPVYDGPPSSPIYKHKNYFAERLLQARNNEPRLTEKECDIISIVYDTYRDILPGLWDERNFTKRHCGTICRLIKKLYPKSPFSRRVERWYQYRVYICGPDINQLPLNISIQLRILFDAYVEFFLIYLKENGIERKNITQLDMVILMLLYNLNYRHVNMYGWYFLNHYIVNKTPCAYTDRERIKNVFHMINDRILTHNSRDIKPSCYQWFREGHKLKVPTVDKLLDMCLYTKSGVMQYVNYKKNNDIALLYYIDENFSPMKDLNL